jgi:hypothetical protein
MTPKIFLRLKVHMQSQAPTSNTSQTHQILSKAKVIQKKRKVIQRKREVIQSQVRKKRDLMMVLRSLVRSQLGIRLGMGLGLGRRGKGKGKVMKLLRRVKRMKKVMGARKVKKVKKVRRVMRARRVMSIVRKTRMIRKRTILANKVSRMIALGSLSRKLARSYG